MITPYDTWAPRIRRRLQLARGILFQIRGARTGLRFGVGHGVRILYPHCLWVSDDVTIDDYGYLNCSSDKGIHIGTGSSIERNLWLHCGGQCGKSATGFVHIGKDTIIGCNAVLGAGGGIRIGSHVLVGQSVCMHAENHLFRDKTRLIRDQGVVHACITIEDDVWIGSGAIILAGVTIGRGAVIGAGTVVTRDVKDYEVTVGVPARMISRRSPMHGP